MGYIEYEKLANRHVRVIILTELDKNQANKEHKSLGGRLKKYANPALMPDEKAIAWEKAMKEKYEIS